jgi:hypothetical protein
LIGYTFITGGPPSASVFLPEKETNMKFETDMAKYYFENLSYLFTIVCREKYGHELVGPLVNQFDLFFS